LLPFVGDDWAEDRRDVELLAIPDEYADAGSPQATVEFWREFL
jgi:hypothetical protein